MWASWAENQGVGQRSLSIDQILLIKDKIKKIGFNSGEIITDEKYVFLCCI